MDWTRQGARDEVTNGDANRALIRWICVHKIPMVAIKYMHASTHARGYTQIPIIRWTKSIWRTELMQCINTYVYNIHLSREKDRKKTKIYVNKYNENREREKCTNTNINGLVCIKWKYHSTKCQTMDVICLCVCFFFSFAIHIINEWILDKSIIQYIPLC